MLGMNYIYLEAGSGAPRPVPPELVQVVKRALPSAVLIVGGGVRSPEVAVELAKAGADVIVTGNIVEDDLGKALEIIRAVKSFRRR
jgi:phosphoglycerol geranylgeranyltransferase